MGKFNSFITEAKEENYRLLILSNSPDNNEYFHTAERFLDECKKQSVPAYVLFVESGKIVDGKAYNADDDVGFEISDEDTVAIVRGSVASRDAWMDMVSQLEKIGICCVNSRSTIQMCADKYWTALRLADAGVPTPKTALLQNEKQLQASLDTIGETYPLILKTLRGSKGIGVIFIESRRQLSSLIQLLWKQDEATEILLQTYIKSDFDVRVLMLNGEVFAAMRRDVLKGDFRSNFSQGAKVREYKLNDEEIEICIKADKAVNGVWTAVDFIKNGKETFVLEVNSSPGTEGIEDATGRNLIKELVTHFQNRDYWRYTALEIGRHESIHINGIGNIVANFDTGNSARCIIHADEYDTKNNMVTWAAQGKKYKNKIVKMAKWERGALAAEVIERPLISLDITFNGTIYKDVKFAIDDRSEKTTKCLINQDFMKRSNVMINPSRKFVVSDRHEGFEIFNPDSKS
jgi:ribosomal protein S6--L-glutamate ligase